LLSCVEGTYLGQDLELLSKPQLIKSSQLQTAGSSVFGPPVLSKEEELLWQAVDKSLVPVKWSANRETGACNKKV